MKSTDLKDYYIGLDIGTNSVGWAVTDTEYNIPDFNRKAMWGIHLFNEGQTAEARRLKRCQRRRLDRRNQRITLLRELFDKEVCKVDPNFFQRMNESNLHLGDGNKTQVNSLFDDEKYKDKDFHKNYPTMYHLRYELMTSKEKHDIRLVYLALHHIVKYRGHFLFEVSSEEGMPDFKSVLGEYIDIVNDLTESDFSIDLISDDVNSILSGSMGIKEKERELNKLFAAENNVQKAFLKLLTGGSVKISSLFEGIESKDSISLKDSNFDDNIDDLEAKIGEENIEVVKLAKSIVDWVALNRILQGSDSISKSKIKDYDQHKQDLKLLKKSIKEIVPEKYEEVFRKSEEKKGALNNYCSYSGKTKKKYMSVARCSQEEFCKYLLNKVFKGKESEMDTGMLERLKDNTFMPLQTVKNNSIFPNSCHLEEMKHILSNAELHYPFLKEKDGDGITVSEKIVKICQFRIPYFVGPLNSNSPNSWIKRDDTVSVRPWNFEKVVDLNESAERFMNNLVSQCTYLIGEQVLPKNSILYSKFTLLNELNNISINSERIAPEMKQKLYEDKFLNSESNRRITKSSVRDYFVSMGMCVKDSEIGGIDLEIKSSLASYHKLKSVIGEKIEDSSLAEDIIRIITVFGGDRKQLKAKLYETYKGVLTEGEIESLTRIKFEGWGRLSGKFLTGITHTDPVTERSMNIITALKETNCNLQELLSGNYTYVDKINEHNSVLEGKTGESYGDLVEKLYVSPAVKRGIWRSVRIVKELVKIIGHKPAKIFIETTRKPDEIKKRTVSRKAALMDLYKKCGEDVTELFSSLEGQSDARLRGKHLYLYYLQHGKCMYCGKNIDIHDLGNKEMVDTDHIYPQSKIKDDSIHNNLVLTCRMCNQKKLDTYPLKPEIRSQMRPFWSMLRQKDFITAEKYSRLIRTSEFSEEELGKFISRQLVETSQSIKATASVLKKIMGDETDIVYVKGSNVSEFRNRNKFVKCREVNDLHHAKDAYLNIVVGNVYDTKFTKNPLNFVRKSEHYNLNKMFEWDVKSPSTFAWKGGENGSIATVRKYMARDNILYTRLPYIKKGQLFDENVVSKRDSVYPVKSGMDVNKYGGYDNAKIAFFSLVEHEKKGKKVRSIEAYPIHMSMRGKSVPEIEKYLSNSLENPKVLIPYIGVDSLFEIDGFRMTLSGKTGDKISFNNAEQLKLPSDIYQYCKKMINYIEKGNSFTAEDYGLTDESNVMLYDTLLRKISDNIYGVVFQNEFDVLMNAREKFEAESVEEQSRMLVDLLRMFHCNAEKANLKKYDGSGSAGFIQKNKNTLASNESLAIINTSITGLYENKIQLSRL